jgi:Ran GTPase-activating protein (RanGAP) involved in mRNA processing and transport
VLELHGNCVADEACEKLKQALDSLNAGQITSNGATYLANALARNDTLTNLGLAGNQIGDEGVANLASALHEDLCAGKFGLR